MRAVSIRRMSALCAALLSIAALPATAMATSSQEQIDTAIGKAVEYARGQQDPATGEPFGFEHGSFSSDWVATSLAAAGVNAADVHAPGNPSLQDFLFGDYGSGFWAGPPLDSATNYERVTLVAHAAGLDPARLSADTNLPAQIAGRWNPTAGSFGEPSINSTIFGILALKTTPVPAWALIPAVAYLRQRQHDDGGWTFSAAMTPVAKAEPSEPDMTGAAIAALCEAGAPAYDPSVATALAYLQGLLVEATGAFHYAFGDNADATAWAVSGLNACGIDPQSATWRTTAGKTPIDHLLSLQVPSGSEAGGFGYENTSEANLYSTQDALRAIAGGVFTATPPGRVDPTQPSVRPAPSVASGTPVPHLLAIELAPGNVRMCEVTAAAGAPLSQILDAARTDAAPAGCVTSFSVAAGQIAAVDGVVPAGQDEAWLLRLDRGAEAVAGEQPVGFGDVVALRIGKRPAAGQDRAGPAGQGGPAGKAGDSGSRGKHGAKGRAGRKGRVVCRAHRRRSGKHTRRCAIKHRHRGQRSSH
ncbi:MAG TPA: prenyltransferase/squalene oxidase repeat-containing protein [Solirubrobacterales bacterium]|nr:prenyltransferase/squalene oxidase repeat-containing protein [Solirubrobacterales bacterium]